jgi:hypothetical protein
MSFALSTVLGVSLKNLSKGTARLYGHLIQAHTSPGECYDTTAEIFSGV